MFQQQYSWKQGTGIKKTFLFLHYNFKNEFSLYAKIGIFKEGANGTLKIEVLVPPLYSIVL